MDTLLKSWIVVSRIVLLCIALYFFGWPFGVLCSAIRNPELKQGGIPPIAFKLHQNLSPKYGQWAQERVENADALKVGYLNVSGTEWPIFGSMFYLMATESLQDEWEENPCTSLPPKLYAKDTIESSINLVLDPAHAAWVKDHWGDLYMSGESAFYRFMRIGSMTAYTNITGNLRFIDQLRSETNTLASDIDASPIGLIDDYPGECYPSDVMMACLVIKNADPLIGEDHTAMLNRAIRGFQFTKDSEVTIPPFRQDRTTGGFRDAVRGSSNSHVTLCAPYLWPDQAKIWYELHEKHYWRTRLGFSGFLEFEEADDIDLYFDVDCGPVIAGFSFTANAFGVGASRANARYDHAYPLTLQMLATSWPLPNGALLVPRTLSDGTDAPYLGEAAILYNLTRNPPSELIITKARNEPKAPRYVLIMMLMYLLPFGLICTASTVDLVRITRKRGFRLPFPIVQAVLLVWMLSIAVFSLGIVSNVFGVMCLMGMACFPILRFEKI